MNGCRSLPLPLRFLRRILGRNRIPLALALGAAHATWPGDAVRPDWSGPSSGESGRPATRSQLDRTGPGIPLLTRIVAALGHPEDLTFRILRLRRQEIVIVFIDGLVKRSTVSRAVVIPISHLLTNARDRAWGLVSLETVQNSVVTATTVHDTADLDALITSLLDGGALILSNLWDQALVTSVRGFETRRIKQPQMEAVTRGPKEGFTENLRTNTALIRRRLRTPKLVFERVRIGTESNTGVVIAWLRDVVNQEVLAEVRQRLARIEMDAVLTAGYLEEWLEDNPFSPFPQLGHTERPDVAAAALLNGRVVIMVDGTPTTLLVPVALTYLLHAADDYYHDPWIASLTRSLRYVSAIVAFFLPAMSVVLFSFQPELIPTPLLLSLIRARETVPYPVALEVGLHFLIVLTLLEANVRMPRPVGAALTIVGGVVIGRAAIESGLMSASIVIVGSTTLLATLTIPTYSLGTALRWLALAMVLPASILGLAGVLFSALAILIHLCGLRSFGLPYLTPYAPLLWADAADSVFRSPLWLYGRRRNPDKVAEDGSAMRISTPPQQPPRPDQRLELERGGGRPAYPPVSASTHRHHRFVR
ncbi:MAG: spore germination protein [Limnochordales bacterium]|nr:spore germination protein [Limnochordales bacterium]